MPRLTDYDRRAKVSNIQTKTTLTVSQSRYQTEPNIESLTVPHTESVTESNTEPHTESHTEPLTESHTEPHCFNNSNSLSVISPLCISKGLIGLITSDNL